MLAGSSAPPRLLLSRPPACPSRAAGGPPGLESRGGRGRLVPASSRPSAGRRRRAEVGDGLSALWPGERTVSRWALAARGRDSPVSSPRVWGLPCGFPRGEFGSPPPSPPFSSLHEPQMCFTERAGVTGILARARPRVWVVAVCHSALLEVICIILWGDG